MIKIKSGFYSKNDQNGKTKAVAWNAIWTAMKPEKKIWAAEIELYLLAMTNGLSGIRKMWKMVSMFSKFVSSIRRHVVDNLIWDVFESQMALEIKISHSKNNFGSKSYQKFNSDDFKIFKIGYQIPCQFLIFSFRSKIIKFHIFSSILVRFCS